MKLLDIHSHHLSEDPFRAILNIRFPKDKFFPEAGRFYSVGVHPWEVTLENRIDWTLFEELAGHPQVLAMAAFPIYTYFPMQHVNVADSIALSWIFG